MKTQENNVEMEQIVRVFILFCLLLTGRVGVGDALATCATNPSASVSVISKYGTAFNDAGGADSKLEIIKSNSKLVSELKDFYRAFHVNNLIVEQKEMINLRSRHSSRHDIKGLLDECIEVCDSLKKIHFQDDTLSSYVRSYLALIAESYTVARGKGFNSTEFKEASEKCENQYDKYLSYLKASYSISHFISMTEEKYWETQDKKNYIRSADYDTYKSLKATNIKQAVALLHKISRQTTDFQEYSIIQIELADQYVKHNDIFGDNARADEKAIGLYKGILDQKKYSIYLYEAWAKWRVITQRSYGASKESDIPNSEYDKMREHAATTILDYIAANEKDEMAINQFLVMASHPIVKRFGGYPYGNQNAVEYSQMFD